MIFTKVYLLVRLGFLGGVGLDLGLLLLLLRRREGRMLLVVVVVRGATGGVGGGGVGGCGGTVHALLSGDDIGIEGVLLGSLLLFLARSR